MIDEIEIVKVENEIEPVSVLAKEIWTEHFTPIIGIDQVNYMLNKYQSIEAISAQIVQGYEYFIVKHKEQSIAYFGLNPEFENNILMISKLYCRLDFRGKGLGKAMLNFIEDKALKVDISTLWLTVNRFNQSSVSWYLNRGFKIVKEEKTDIGSGFFMDDFIMEKTIHSSRV